MTHIVILTDNNYSDTNETFLRGTGAHRIATVLRSHSYNVEVIDYILRWNIEDFQKICQKLIDENTLMLGLSVNLFTDNDSFAEKIRWFRSFYPNIPVVMGGNNLLARDIDLVDYLIEGYAEIAMVHFLAFLSGRIGKNQIKWSPIVNKPLLIDANKDYPCDDTNDLTIRYQDSDFIRHHETLAIETARGCVFKCRFCTYPLIGKHKNDFLRNSDNIRDELLHNYQEYGVKNYVLAEDTFNDSVEKLENLARAIRHLPFQPNFASYLRFDLILSRPHTLPLLREIGLKAAYFGIETFNPSDLKLIRKTSHADKLKDGLLWWADEAKDIASQVGLIMGFPNANEAEAWETNEWLSKSGINWWNWQALWFTDVKKTIHTSDFSYNYKTYGYEVMTDNEVNQALEDEKRDKSSSLNNLFTYNTKSYRQKMMFWKHNGNGMNFFKAASLCNNLNAASKTRKIGGFTALINASLGFDLSEIVTWGYYDVKPHVPKEEICFRTKSFIDEYIQKKISWNYQGKNIALPQNDPLPKTIMIKQTQTSGI